MLSTFFSDFTSFFVSGGQFQKLTAIARKIRYSFIDKEKRSCRVCGYTNHDPDERNLRKHIIIHSRISPEVDRQRCITGDGQVCKLCGFRGPVERVLDHLELHVITGKKYKCLGCKALFSNGHGLAIHKNKICKKLWGQMWKSIHLLFDNFLSLFC